MISRLFLCSFFISLWCTTAFGVSQCSDLFSTPSHLNTASHNYYSSYVPTEKWTADILSEWWAEPEFRDGVRNRIRGDELLEADPAFKPRMDFMLDRTLRLIESRRDSEVVIIFNGSAHSRALFDVLGERSDVLYFSPDLSTINYHPILLRLQKLFPEANKISREEREFITRAIETVKNASIHSIYMRFSSVDLNYSLKLGDPPPMLIDQFYFLQSIAANTLMRDGGKGYPNTTREVDLPINSKVGSIVINDHHGLSSTQFLKQLPSYEELQAQGVTKIKVAIEGHAENDPNLRFPQKLTAHSFINVIDSLIAISKKNGGKKGKQELIDKLNSSPALRSFKMAFSVDVAIYPIEIELMKVIQSQYMAHGIKVEFIGIEE